MAVTRLSFPTCNTDTVAPLPGGFGRGGVFWAEAQELRRCREQRSGREGNCNSLFFFFFGLDRREMTHHSFTSKFALSGLLYFCFYLLPRIGAARLTTVHGAASAALCFGLKRCCGADGPLRMLVLVSHGARAFPPRTAPTLKGWEGCFVCEQQREKIFGLSIETLGG